MRSSALFARALVWLATFVVMLAPGRARAQALTPPSIAQLEPLPAHHERELIVEALVGVDGLAALEACDATLALCEAVHVALERSRFVPALRDGAPIAARVRIRWDPVAFEPVLPEDDAPWRVRSRREPPPFRARAEVSPVAPAVRRLELIEARDAPGSMGDPLRAIESLPGVVPVANGVPYAFVRGSPPAGTLYVYDGIPLPQLFHLALGPAVVHPRMLGAIELHAGAAPARWGRHIGGVILAEGPDDRAPLDGTHGEIEVRLLDVSGYFETPLPNGGRFAGALRIGWSSLLAGAFVQNLELGFGDYQLRATVPLDAHDDVQVVALGSYDRFAYSSEAGRATHAEIQFHRVEARVRRRAGAFSGLAALRAGWDRTDYFGGLESATHAETGHVAARLEGGLRDRFVSWRAGGDVLASFGRNPEIGLRNTFQPQIQDALTRSTAALWTELTLLLLPELTIDVGARVDTWMYAQRLEGALDPRLRIAWRPITELTLHVGAGVARQPPGYYLPVPGTNDLILAPGLQTAMQLDGGATFELGSFRAELQLFVHRYEDLVFSDFLTILDERGACDPLLELPEDAYCPTMPLVPRTNGISWGGEGLIAIAPRERVSGWISYTLSWSELDPISFGGAWEVAMRPSYDVRHVLNAVARWEIVPGLSVGARVHLRSGGPRGFAYRDFSMPLSLFERVEREVTPFARLDASIAYAWDAGWGRLRVSIEWLNVTFAQEAIALVCAVDGDGIPIRCNTDRAPPIVAPNLGLRIEL
ncbi:TonB-dependent receptor domain-containing protein [Sandaracinus amylolyticus]|uniref:TonB family protein / TonB-dependent receptor n=1 Tax=Sandaracinus amylolyticus TaxID=927083 RepID=A0A0F6YMC0_9BACT|nr:TonB-dependent receptor [Sandaracinus amylolyticus]AKF10591.1 TonB family protein / TonB-dependent receptor [Sandaracinus amylolyticus]